MTHLEISYGPGQFDLYPGSNHGPVIVFVHGGAWRSEDKAHHAQLARALVAATACHVAVPNYRLTPANNTDPALRHPAHAADVRAFLHFLTEWRDPPVTVDVSRLVLLGHSCSAHMLCAILLQSDEPALTPRPALLRAVKAVVLSEGIYDIDALLLRFPTYREWFIDAAFGPPSPGYARFNALTWPLRDESRIEWLILHSKGDTLVDTAQSESMHIHLAALDPQRTSLNMDDLVQEHNDNLRSEAYTRLVREFVQKVLGV